MRATSRSANIKMNHMELDTDKFKDVKLPMQQSRHGGFNRSGPGLQQALQE